MKYKKFLGQHFLHDTVKIARMINEIAPQKNDVILEIGPGAGALTKELVKYAGKIIAIEIDNEAIKVLLEKLKNYNNLKIINADFLKIDLKEIFNENNCKKFKIVGNIPYYITGPIIEKIIRNKELVDSAYLTVQKEVAERIVASEGTKKYGSLSVFVQFYANAKILFKIGKKAFFPEPKVDSAFIKFDFNKGKINVKDEELFFKIVHIAFSKRRKKILNNLSNDLKIKKDKIMEIFNELKIKEDSRVENISIVDFVKISDRIYEILKQ